MGIHINDARAGQMVNALARLRRDGLGHLTVDDLARLFDEAAPQPRSARDTPEHHQPHALEAAGLVAGAAARVPGVTPRGGLVLLTLLAAADPL